MAVRRRRRRRRKARRSEGRLDGCFALDLCSIGDSWVAVGIDIFATLATLCVAFEVYE